MTTAAQLRSRYAREAVTTASPARLVTMLYDRLVRDLDDAELAISLANPQAAHALLRHAQDIVQELSGSLDVSRWDGGARACSACTPGCSSGSSPPTWPRTPRSSSSAARSSSRCATRGTRRRTSSRRLVNSSWLGHPRRLRPAPGRCSPGWWTRAGTTRWSPSSRPPTCPRCRGCSSPAPRSCWNGPQALAERVADLRDETQQRRVAPRRPVVRHARRVGVPGPAGLTTLRSPAAAPMGEGATSSS